MKLLVILLWGFTLGTALAQPNANQPARELVKEGVQLHDEGKYNEAVAKYEAALKVAPGDVLATSELALTYNAQERYEEAAALCKKLLKANPKADASVYISYGNSLDALKRPKEALQAYEQGLKHHPNEASLYFNQGVTQARSGQVPPAIISFQQAVVRNPRHASSHLYLGLLQAGSKAQVPTIMTLARFLVLEPLSARAKQHLAILDQTMVQGVTQTGEKSFTIGMTVESVRAAGKDRNKPDNFGLTEMMLNLVSVRTMSKDSSATSSISKFSQQFQFMCKSLAEHKKTGTGFMWSYYAPYFAELEQKGFVPALSYLIHSSQTDKPEVQQWLAAHPAEVAVFQEWSKNYTWPTP